MDILLKRIVTTEGSKGDGGGGGGDEIAPEMGSEEMEVNLQRILEKIDCFTQQEGNEGDGGGGGGDEMAPEMGSEEMELNLQRILEKIDRFTQQVGQLLETGKTLFKNQLSEFEERLILIHKEQIERWQDEIKELQLCDAANERARATNERARALLGNAQHLLSGARQDSVIHNVHEGF